MKMMEEDSDATPLEKEKIRGVQRQQILSAAGREGDTPAAAVLIPEMKVEGRQENFHHPAEPSAGGAAGPSASAEGGSTVASAAI